MARDGYKFFWRAVPALTEAAKYLSQSRGSVFILN